MEVVLDTPSAALKRSGYRTRKVSVSSGSQLDTETEAEEDKSVARPSKRLKVSHSRVADTLPGSLVCFVRILQRTYELNLNENWHPGRIIPRGFQ